MLTGNQVTKPPENDRLSSIYWKMLRYCSCTLTHKHYFCFANPNIFLIFGEGTCSFFFWLCQEDIIYYMIHVFFLRNDFYSLTLSHPVCQGCGPYSHPFFFLITIPFFLHSQSFATIWKLLLKSSFSFVMFFYFYYFIYSVDPWIQVFCFKEMVDKVSVLYGAR